MKKPLLFFALLSALSGSAQNIRINFLGGLSNHYGEMQIKKLTFDQSNFVFGIGASLDLTNKLLLRSEFSSTRVGADDKRGFYPTRNLNFKSEIREGSLLLEYNLWDLAEKRITPYAFAGVGLFKFNPYTYDSADRKVFLQPLGTEGQGLAKYPDRKMYKTTQFNIPVGGGLKYAISDDVYFGFEYGLRILFTDYLDDVSTTYADQNTLLAGRGPLAVAVAFRGDELKNNPRQYPREGTLRGSSKVVDLYYFGVARLSIRMNWFENGGGMGGRRNNFGCPGRVL